MGIRSFTFHIPYCCCRNFVVEISDEFCIKFFLFTLSFQRQVVRSYSSQLEYPTVPPPIEMPTITVHYPPPTVTQVTPERTPNSEEKASLVSNVGNEQAEGANKGSLSSWYEDWEIADDDNTWKSAKAPTRLGKN